MDCDLVTGAGLAKMLGTEWGVQARAAIRERLSAWGIPFFKLNGQIAISRADAINFAKLVKQPSANGPVFLNKLAGEERLVRGELWVYSPSHPRASNGYVRKSVVVWEQKTRDSLRPGEKIRFRNNNRLDLRIENMYLHGPALCSLLSDLSF